MNPLTWGFLGTLIGTIVGASASILTTLINSRNHSKNIRNLEIYKRQEIFREFQRDNYLKIQETIYKTFRLATLLHLEDIENLKKTGMWQKSLLNSKNDNGLMIALKDLSIYLERIQNDDAREELRTLIEKISSTSKTSSKTESEAIMFDIATNHFDKTMANLGIELRKNY